MKTILVTGAVGFIGSATCLELINKGFTVIGIDNMNNYYDIRLKKYRLNILRQNSNFVFEKIDIVDSKSLGNIFKNYSIDAVINLAARAGVRHSIKDPNSYIDTNVKGTINILRHMNERGISKLVLSSTSSLYAGQKMPFHESLSVNTPISPYAASKKAAEMICYTYHYLYNLDVTILRYFTVYGPAGRPDMSVFKFIKQIDEDQNIEVYGDGNQSRDFTYIDDIARGTCLALKQLGYEVINLGGGKEPCPLNHIIGLIEKYLNKKAKVINKAFQPTDIMATRANINRANSILQWEPQISIEEGLSRTVTWHTENRNWVKELVLSK